MNRKEIDKMWNKALREAVEDGQMYTRYHFAALVAAAEREACAKVVESLDGCAQYFPHVPDDIRARGQV